MLFDKKVEQALRAVSLQDAEFANLIQLFVSYGSGKLTLPDADGFKDGLLLHLVARVVMLEQAVDELLLGKEEDTDA